MSEKANEYGFECKSCGKIPGQSNRQFERWVRIYMERDGEPEVVCVDCERMLLQVFPKMGPREANDPRVGHREFPGPPWSESEMVENQMVRRGREGELMRTLAGKLGFHGAYKVHVVEPRVAGPRPYG